MRSGNLIVDNRPGAGSINGTDLVRRRRRTATHCSVAASFTINPTCQNCRSPDHDFAPVTQLAALPHHLAFTPRAVKSVKELIALVMRAGQINYASSGVGPAPISRPSCSAHDGADMVNGLTRAARPRWSHALGECSQFRDDLHRRRRYAPQAPGAGVSTRSARCGAGFPTIAEPGVAGYDHSRGGLLAPANPRP